MTDRGVAIEKLLRAASWDDGGAPALDYPDAVDALAALGVTRAEVDQIIDDDVVIGGLDGWRDLGLRMYPQWKVVDA
ncbi:MULTISPECIES: hypothetical protein [Pseudonocardia]|uniref:Uncharacterized protein n=2 Tax=Pseudonocardia TaxID=1847 RepID=A0A1Y2N671_PSEAH|nr:MULTISPECIES: hypothetical protein [Pseudonocardia]OSY42970.1 hypothetical protein BG845_01212 [Pseudonocardia autotrophica]TDN77546.1 hypothetical protein C8E95_6794 [Pseudonocardia autotrophica]BBG01574.1 hypothetical protein Pdca_27830 [Pseudonocardia autotrophica]GEC29077.1 hypothetical protein PSA01_61060 [Pseudonocardia saturnea]